ncbi:hypothetical protein PpBr36_04184 [Pyricularia pennisetigena]|uniref:hypothetical protein n=1 Tax=Pyricularia pennisetigena TaxID=1578925 RepID=UPI00114F9098|nr:hypothetical protein PpBr36_04184 [Pyricularia pennisetigena]TLS27420.1 hypothetical protein PpBr36_04184 [Pyricularia pennisetigena]
MSFPRNMWLLSLLAGATLAQAATASDFAAKCQAFQPERLVKNSTRTRLEYVASGTTIQLDDNVPSCGRTSQVVDTNICRIALQIPTSNRSSLSFELWLPERWDGKRYVATGNGGVDGCIKYEDIAYGVKNGFAAMGTNNGHNGTTGVDFLNNEDVVVDFSYRALHTGTVSAKILIQEFYSSPPAKSYYIGCSLGGRQGISAAERFPEDYDGILAGAPAVDFNHLYSLRARMFTITGSPGSPDYISASTWSGLIHDEVLSQCDGLDGVADGIIEIANKCHFDPTTLLCRADQADQAGQACLSQAQVAQVQTVYAPYTYANGTLLWPRMNPGAEILASAGLLAGRPFSPSVEWFRYAVLSDPAWDPATYDLADAEAAETSNPGGIRTFPESLPAFKARGGRIVAYHGEQDQQIWSSNSERFYDRLAAADPGLDSYLRFFRISGMNHCAGGPGAWMFGQGGSSASIPFEPERNAFAALVAWVEKGQAPEAITGTKLVNDSVDQGIDFQRSHCRYPLEQTYISGPSKQPASWQCLPPSKSPSEI